MKNILKFLNVITLIPTTSLLVISCTSQTKETKKTKKPNTEVKKPKNPTPTFSPNKQTIDEIKNILEQQSEAFGSFHTFQDVVDQIKVYAQNQGIKDLDKLELLDKTLANKNLIPGDNKNNFKLKYFDIEIPFVLKTVLQDEVKTKYSPTNLDEITQIGYKKYETHIRLNIEKKTITKVPVTLPLKINSFYNAFQNLKTQNIINLDKWNTSTNNMFADAESFNQDISKWDTSNVIDMYGMFARAKSFRQSLKKWNVRKVVKAQNFRKEIENNLIKEKMPLFNQDVLNHIDQK
ncbi:BspA family leucine-rich repeat surface protein [Mycoplasma sp. 06067-C1-B144P-99-0482-3]|uniref:BspA family leucine-rich repeat surface protein n=1 Tax=Mycoplasma sp. 06067-C1-B144P-99-0482-3 TaxID=3117438 RepID=UPI003DA6B1F2